MSEKIKEFLEVPQDFIREGNQVRHSAVPHPPSPSILLNPLRSFLFDAQNPLEKVFELVSSLYKCIHLHAASTRRICPDFQGCRDRFRRHGVHWLLGKAHSYSYVSVDDFV